MNAGDKNKPGMALSGIRVLDFSHALAGPYCTLLLADYGAEIYKLESAAGDMGRGWGPPFAGGVAIFYLAPNRDKHARQKHAGHGVERHSRARLFACAGWSLLHAAVGRL